MAAPEARSQAANKMATSERFPGSKTHARVRNLEATTNSPRIIRRAEESPEEAKHLNKRTVMTPDTSSNAKPQIKLSPFRLFGNVVSNLFMSKIAEEEKEEDLKKGDENETFEDAQEVNMSENQLDAAPDDEVMLTELLSKMSPERIAKTIRQVQKVRGLQFLELKAEKIDATTQVKTPRSKGPKKPLRTEPEVDNTATDDFPDMENIQNKGRIVKIYEKSGGYYFGFIKSKAQKFFFSGYDALFKQYDEVQFDIVSQQKIKGKLPTASNIKLLSKREIFTGSVVNVVLRKTYLFGFVKPEKEQKLMYFSAAAKALIKIGDVFECVLGPVPENNTKKQTCFLLELVDNKPKSANLNTNPPVSVVVDNKLKSSKNKAKLDTNFLAVPLVIPITAPEITTVAVDNSIPMDVPKEIFGQHDTPESTLLVSKPIASSQ